MVWHDAMKIDAEGQYQDLVRAGIFPCDHTCRAMAAMLTVAEPDTGWVFEVVKHLADAIVEYLESKTDEFVIGNDDARVSVPPAARRLLSSVAATCAALHFLPYATSNIDMSGVEDEEMVESVTWQNGIVERLMVSTAIHFRALCDNLRENGTLEEAASHFGIRDDGREDGQSQSEQRPGDVPMP